MNEAKFIMFENRLAKVYKHLSKQAGRQSLSCFRIFDKDLPEFPLIIDVYDDKVYLAEYRAKHHLTAEEHEQWLNESIRIISKVLNVADEKIYLKERKRKSERTDQYQKTGEEKAFFTVEEGGLTFKINLSDYLDTGLFLDHRLTREMVRKESSGKKVLNLFAYTGSFSVYAASGGAEEVTTVDLSNTYIKWAEDNFELNGFTDSSKYYFIVADVLQYLDEIKINSFDIIVMDPPTFSNSKKMKEFLDIQQDHVILINKCLLALKPGGILYFSTNFTKFAIESEKINASHIKDITKATTPFDFEGKLRRWCFKIFK
ncbi:MAG: class I SAM-dependent methyltransferase [Sphingobacteriales bacterium]|nr:class I SAM-dependent methyltransferase [Sphingobacteriales bacterium]